MFTRICLSLALLLATPMWSQAVPAASGGAPAENDDTQMQTPPPVSGEPYPTMVGSEARSNYLRGAMNVISAYDDNVLTGTSDHPVGDVTYSILPTISLDQTTRRFQQTLTYSPGFTFYERTSELDEVQGLNYTFGESGCFDCLVLSSSIAITTNPMTVIPRNTPSHPFHPLLLVNFQHPAK